MCGIIGLIAPGRQVSFDLYNGLLNLQHRGQDNAGIFTTDENQVYLVKGRGLVAEVFNWKKVEGLKGSMGIGQVRYPTTASKLDSQPFYLDQGGIALAHNGNIYNEKSLRRRLEDSRIYCDSDCDAETILKVFAYYFNRKTGPIAQRCFAAAKKTMQKLDGSYSVVAVIRNAGFFAFRDPHAIRPFVWGKKTWNGRVKAYAFASESVAIESLVDSVSNVRPGEAIFISKNLDCQRKILNRKKRAHCFFEWVYFSRSTSIIENISVNRVRWNLGKVLAEIYSQSPLYERLSRGKRQVIVAPVPETARPASLAFAQRLKYQYKDILEKNRFIGRVFLKPNEAIRRQEIAGNMRIIEGVVKDKIVLLIDDSIVRGTTSRGIVQRIRSRGAKEVHLLSTCPPLIYPCFYGVDFPDPAELVAYKRKITEIEAYIGANSITYMTLAGLTKAIGLKENQLCTACLTGRYPTSLDQLVESL